MDVQIIKPFLLVNLMLALASCATLPPQEFKFSLSANSPDESSWSQKGFASAGSLVFKFRLQQAMHDAASIKFIFRSFGSDPTMIVHISDTHCVGAYTISIQYAVNSREQRTVYLKTLLLWGEDSTLSILWDKKYRTLITVNGAESKELNFSQGMRDVHVDVLSGGIDVDRLAYLDSSHPLN